MFRGLFPIWRVLRWKIVNCAICGEFINTGISSITVTFSLRCNGGTLVHGVLMLVCVDVSGARDITVVLDVRIFGWCFYLVTLKVIIVRRPKVNLRCRVSGTSFTCAMLRPYEGA